MAKISAFADEVANDFAKQIEFLVSEGIGYIEIRFVNGKNVLDLSKAELAEAKKMLDANNIAVSAIGSPIGKIRLDEDFPDHLDKFRHTVDLARYFETPFIRVFSYYPADGESIDECRQQVLDRFGLKLDCLDSTDVTMVHENETGIYGHSAENCVDLVKSLDSPLLRLAYDPGNFVWGQGITDSSQSCWPLMKPWVVHVHIKDWAIDAKVGSLPGAGDGQVPELLADLAGDRYDGWLTLEPHLQLGGQFGGHTDAELFSDAVAALKDVSNKAGLKLE